MERNLKALLASPEPLELLRAWRRELLGQVRAWREGHETRVGIIDHVVDTAAFMFKALDAGADLPVLGLLGFPNIYDIDEEGFQGSEAKHGLLERAIERRLAHWGAQVLGDYPWDGSTPPRPDSHRRLLPTHKPTWEQFLSSEWPLPYRFSNLAPPLDTEKYIGSRRGPGGWVLNVVLDGRVGREEDGKHPLPRTDGSDWPYYLYLSVSRETATAQESKREGDVVLAEEKMSTVRRGATLLLVEPIPRKAEKEKEWTSAQALYDTFAGADKATMARQQVAVDYLLRGTRGPELMMIVGFQLQRAGLLSDTDLRAFRKFVQTYCAVRAPDEVGKRLRTKEAGDKLARAYIAVRAKEEVFVATTPSDKQPESSDDPLGNQEGRTQRTSTLPPIRETMLDPRFGRALAKRLNRYAPKFDFPPGPQSFEVFVARHANHVLADFRGDTTTGGARRRSRR